MRQRGAVSGGSVFSADVDGIDACRKIAILASMIFGSEVHPENIPTSGIRGITIDDIYFTKKMKLAIKLIAYAKKDEKTGFSCGVEAMVIHAHHDVQRAGRLDRRGHHHARNALIQIRLQHIGFAELAGRFDHHVAA